MSLSGKVDKLHGLVGAREEQMTSGVSSLRKELGDLAEVVQANATVSRDESSNIVRHLGSFGMIDVGSTFNLPDAVTSIHRMLNDDILPTFKSGGVIPWVASGGDAGNLLLPVADQPFHVSATVCHSGCVSGCASGCASWYASGCASWCASWCAFALSAPSVPGS